MRKTTSAALLLIGTLCLSATGQENSRVRSNNHPSSIRADAPSISPVGQVPVLARNEASATEQLAGALHSEFTTKAVSSETTNSPLGPIPPMLGHDAGDAPVERPEVEIDTRSTSDSAATAVTNTVVTASATEIYRVAIGDVLDVRMPQTPGNKSSLYTVLEGGVLDYPFIRHPVPVAGLTAAEVAALLRQEIKIFDKPEVVVAVRDFASHKVTITGLVGAPGNKPLRREAVPLYVVISQSLPLAEAAQATVVRLGTQPMTVDLSDSKATSILVIPGDVIKVSAMPPAPAEFFFAGGEVTAPGQKPYHAGLTLTQAILASGGLTKNAGTKAHISRQAADGRLVRTEYNLRFIKIGKVPDPVLQKGDRLEMNAQ